MIKRWIYPIIIIISTVSDEYDDICVLFLNLSIKRDYRGVGKRWLGLGITIGETRVAGTTIIGFMNTLMRFDKLTDGCVLQFVRNPRETRWTEMIRNCELVFEQKVEHIQTICNPLYNVDERTLKNLKSFHPYDHKMELNRKCMPYQGNEPFCQFKFRNRDDLLN